ncbi:MAG: hypothetical protein M3Y06_12135, partial [Actinomycetota bacterium]|nr:hypothetical protein [Actinomycetota bacterium]
MKLSRLISTLGATACALALAVGSSASASLPTPVGPPPNPAAHSARADGTAIANVFTPPNLEASFVPIAPC